MTTHTPDATPVRTPQPPTFIGLIDTIAGREAIDPELASRLAAVREYLVAPDDAGRPFLTVLLRTQAGTKESRVWMTKTAVKIQTASR